MLVGMQLPNMLPVGLYKPLSYDSVLVMNWLKYTNPVIYWVACFPDFTVNAKLHTVLALSVNSVATVALPSLKQVLAEVNCCLAWLGFLHPHSLLETKRVLVA